MNEKQYALDLKNKYDEARQQFEHPNILGSLDKLNNVYKLDFNKLKNEVNKLNYFITLAKDINIPFWQEQWKQEPTFVFYKNQEDL